MPVEKASLFSFISKEGSAKNISIRQSYVFLY